MTVKEEVSELDKVMKQLESIDFLSHERSILNANQLKIHKAYNIIEKLKKDLEGGTKDG